MDCADLLARENEFKKLNKQLEKKTESLMKQIEHVMQKPDFFSDFSHNLSISPYNTQHHTKHQCSTVTSSYPSSENSTPSRKKIHKNATKNNIAKQIVRCNCSKEIAGTNCPKEFAGSCSKEDAGSCSKEFAGSCSKEDAGSCRNCKNIATCDCCSEDVRKVRITEDLEFLYAFVSVCVDEKVLPASFLKERATVENVCKFLSSKVKLMQEQIDKLQVTINKKAQQCEIHLTHQAELESERMSLLNKCNNLQAATNDMRAKYGAALKRLEEKDRLYKEQRSEADKLTSEVKKLRAKNANVEARYASLEKSAESLKHQLEAGKRAEKEFREAARKLTSEHQASITKLESNIKELSTRCQKQAELINNLKEQRTLLAAEGAVKALEKQFLDFLKDF